MEQLDLNEMVIDLADKTLNAVLDDATFVSTPTDTAFSGNIDLALRYLAVVEEGLARLKTHLVCDFAGSTSVSAMARALGISRQTFYHRYSAVIKERSEALLPVRHAFHLRFAHAQLAAREASGKEFTDRQGEYFNHFIDILRKCQTDDERKDVIGYALQKRVIDANTIAWGARALEQADELNAEQADELDTEEPKLNLRKPASSRPPENLTEEWNRFREEA